MTSNNVPTSWRARSSAAAFLVAAGLLLAGCAGGAPADPGTATAAATQSASASPSPTPTPTMASEVNRSFGLAAPALPRQANENTKEGLESFAKYYVELLEYSYMSGDTGKLKAVNSPSCTTCSGPIGDISNAYSKGGWVVGGDLTVTAASTAFLRSAAGSVFVNLSIRQGRTAYYSGPGDLRKDVPAPVDEAPMQLTANFVKGAWQVEDFAPPKGL